MRRAAYLRRYGNTLSDSQALRDDMVHFLARRRGMSLADAKSRTRSAQFRTLRERLAKLRTRTRKHPL